MNNNNNNSKAIVCHNIADKLSDYQEKLVSYMIEQQYVGDVIVVEGKLHTEMKGALATSFTSQSSYAQSITYNDNCMYPRILLGTSGG
jgi:hypothetical protein